MNICNFKKYKKFQASCITIKNQEHAVSPLWVLF